jgi:hypothetical protein
MCIYLRDRNLLVDYSFSKSKPVRSSDTGRALANIDAYMSEMSITAILLVSLIIQCNFYGNDYAMMRPRGLRPGQVFEFCLDERRAGI